MKVLDTIRKRPGRYVINEVKMVTKGLLWWTKTEAVEVPFCYVIIDTPDYWGTSEHRAIVLNANKEHIGRVFIDDGPHSKLGNPKAVKLLDEAQFRASSIHPA
ncbi:hypothetical protein Acj9p118 [Acinetobacter phage Acj9]|uniref:Uncharacterized protein n=1 Tax=Acinetobacter phage Acj9 TaxID=760939 RepID=E5EPQ2_9CAUD|nr:hypothetical protein Acj9p118 [Acinetobacter phage Acj9]ADG60018.1 hypothetical protein Acj9p118 [Acinetobacter phage Acj9]